MSETTLSAGVIDFHYNPYAQRYYVVVHIESFDACEFDSGRKRAAHLLIHYDTKRCCPTVTGLTGSVGPLCMRHAVLSWKTTKMYYPATLT